MKPIKQIETIPMLTLSASMLGSRTTEKFPESRQVFPCLPFAYGSLKDPFPVAAKTVVQNRFSLLSTAAHCSDIPLAPLNDF